MTSLEYKWPDVNVKLAKQSKISVCDIPGVSSCSLTEVSVIFPSSLCPSEVSRCCCSSRNWACVTLVGQRAKLQKSLDWVSIQQYFFICFIFSAFYPITSFSGFVHSITVSIPVRSVNVTDGGTVFLACTFTTTSPTTNLVVQWTFVEKNGVGHPEQVSYTDLQPNVKLNLLHVGKMYFALHNTGAT